MRRIELLNQARIASGTNSTLGAWLLLSPWTIGYLPRETPSLWANVITGAAIGVFGMARLLWPRDGVVLSWSNVFLGGWTALLPWSFQFLNNPILSWNCVFVGMAVAGCARWSVAATNSERSQPHP